MRRVLLHRFITLCKSVVRTLLVLAVFSIIYLSSYIDKIQPALNGTAYIVTLNTHAYQWPLLLALVMACIIDYEWRCSTQSVVMGNVVQRGGTFDASIGKTTISW